MPLRFVLFDLVGTLLDEASDHESLDGAMAAVVRRYGIELPPSEMSGRFTLALMEIIRSEPEVEEPAPFLPFREAAPEIFSGLMQTLGVRVEDDDKRWFWETYLKSQRRAWRPYREVVGVLKRIEAMGMRMGVVTDADRYLIDDILPRLGLSRFLTIGVSAEEAGHPKPHPALFEAALEQAAVTPQEAMMVGDSFERDIEGARAAGIGTGFLVDRHEARTVDMPKGPDLRALADWLEAQMKPARVAANGSHGAGARR